MARQSVQNISPSSNSRPLASTSHAEPTWSGCQASVESTRLNFGLGGPARLCLYCQPGTLKRCEAGRNSTSGADGLHSGSECNSPLRRYPRAIGSARHAFCSPISPRSAGGGGMRPDPDPSLASSLKVSLWNFFLPPPQGLISRAPHRQGAAWTGSYVPERHESLRLIGLEPAMLNPRVFEARFEHLNRVHRPHDRRGFRHHTELTLPGGNLLTGIPLSSRRCPPSRDP